ncbi:MAG TPA: acyltransferase family protein [Ktedonobacterales bacterium]|nr:acyltransferase family protein [Ktedonobacterales bacterium]
MTSIPEQTTSARVGTDIMPIQSTLPATSRVRLFFLDHLRAALTILVVLHHLAVIYGAAAVFYYVEPPAQSDQLTPLVLGLFVLLNQSYFMGAFFLISGYFTPGSFDRKGPKAFYQDRLLRLGIPLVAFVLILSPLASIGLYQTPASFPHLTLPFTWQQVPALLSVGPLWFAALLLLFDLGYVFWRQARRTHGQPTEHASRPPSYWMVGLFILVLAAASYLLRIVVPLGATVLIFPSLAYLPQYLSFFILGAIAVRRHWFETIPGSMGITGLVGALLATVVLAPLALSGGAAFLGSGSMQSAAYALWDSIFSVGICLALLTMFRRCFNRQSRFGRFLSQHAFTVYIIHIPVIVLLALAIRGIHLEPLLKFGLAALIGVPLCFALAALVRKLPGASKIL